MPEDAEIMATKPVALLVDDNDLNLTVCENLLELAGVDYDSVTSGRQAIDKVGQRNYDIVLMDYMMPEMDGVEATRIIREMGFEKLPVIALTANVVGGAREMLIQAGMNDFISKPIDQDAFNRLLAKWLPRYDIAGSQGTAPAKDTSEIARLRGVSGLNVNAALPLFANNSEKYVNIIKIFSGKAEKLVNDINEAWKQNDLKSLSIQVHGIKSTLANIGAISLSQLANSLEEALARDDVNCLTEQLPRLINGVSDIITRVSAVLDKEPVAKVPEKRGTTEQLRYAAGDALHALEMLQNERAKKIVDDLCGHDFGEAANSALRSISSEIHGFYFDTAIEQINKLLESL